MSKGTFVAIGQQFLPPDRFNTKHNLNEISRWTDTNFPGSLTLHFFSKTPKTVLLISQQQNTVQRLFFIQNELSAHIKTIAVAFLQAE